MLLIRCSTILVVWWMSASAPAVATDLSTVPNAIEIKRLPPYCAAKFRSPQDPNEVKLWRGRIGSNWLDIHHYCAGLNFVNRYWGANTASDRSFYLQEAKGNFDYMVKAEKPDFALRTELYTNRGEVLKLMGHVGEAILDFNRAIETNPRFPKPYLQLIDLYEDEKNRNKSLEVATNGLLNNPDSIVLQHRYLEMGGKLPYPKPIQTEAVKTESASKTEPSTSEPGPTAVDIPAEPAAQPKIGSPTNPYCRFCPD